MFSFGKPGVQVARSTDVFRMMCCRTSGFVDSTSMAQLRMFFLRRPEFVNVAPAEGETSIDQLADRNFLEVHTQSHTGNVHCSVKTY